MKLSVLRIAFILIMVNLAFFLAAQVTVSGRVIGSDAPNGLAGAAISLTSAANQYDTESNETGNFSINNVQGTAAGIQYQLSITLTGYQEHTSPRIVRTEPLNLGNIRLDEEAWAPRNVVATEDDEEENVRIVWDVPEPIEGTEQWIHWDSGQNADGIGVNGPVQFIVGARFTPAQLEELDVTGLFVTTVRFFPREAATYTIRVYRNGAGAPLNPGQQIISQQVVNPTINQWNQVILNNPVQILPEQELWIAYHINTQVGFPAGCDAGPAVNNFGNIMFWNNAWTTLTVVNPQLTYNWNIQAYAGMTRGDSSIPLVVTPPDESEQQISSVELDETILFAKASDFEDNNETISNTRINRIADRNSRPTEYRELEGYKVYRLNVEDEEDPEEWVNLVASTTDTTYTDTAWNTLQPGYYKYAVQAIYTANVLSDFALSNALPNGLDFNVTGRVLGSDNANGLAGAVVTFEGLENYQVETGADGRFTINDVLGSLEQTQYSLTIRKSGYQLHTSNHNVTTENLNLGNIVLAEIAYQAHSVFAELNEDEEMDISWSSPINAIPQYLHWDSGENQGGIGTNAVAQFSVAARFNAAQLEELDVVGLMITSVRFFPRYQNSVYTVKVWRGGSGAPFNPGQEAASQIAEGFVNEQWNEVILNNPVRILPGQELWFGYHINTQGGHPAGYGAGPAVDTFGNLMHINNEWRTLLSLNPQFDYNWNLQAFAGYSRGDRSLRIARDTDANERTTADSPFTTASSYIDYGQLQLAADKGVFPSENWRPGRISAMRTGRNSFDPAHFREFEDYKLYRLNVEDIEDPEEWVHLATQTDTTFTDTEWEDLDPGAFRYAVVAMYTNDIASEPAFSNVVVNRMELFVTVNVTSNSGDPVTGAVVKLINNDGNPEHEYSEAAPENGVVVFQNVWRGTYTIEARHTGFNLYRAQNVAVDDDIFIYPLELIESLAEVVDLAYEVFNNNNVRLTWKEPGAVAGTERWIHWDTGVNNDGIGTNSAAQFSVVSRFTPENIAALDIGGLYLTAIKIFPREIAATYTIRVWRGGTATPSLNPGNMVIFQQVTNVINEAWNTVQLNIPVEIRPDQELWFGYHINTQAGFPAGVDAGPAVDTYGNVMHFNNEWQTLRNLNPQLNYNWNLQAYAGFLDGSLSVPVSRARLDRIEREESKDRAFLGYKVTRNGITLADDIQTLFYRDISIPIGNYEYSVYAVYTTGDSEPATTEVVTILSADDDTNVPLVTQLQGNYPNPFNPETKITFSIAEVDNVNIEIFNMKGQKVKTLIDNQIEAGNHFIVWDGKNDNGSEVGSGIYFYRMKSGSYSTTRKMILMK